MTLDDYAVEIDLPENLYPKFRDQVKERCQVEKVPVIVKFETALVEELGGLMVKFLVIGRKLGVHKEELLGKDK